MANTIREDAEMAILVETTWGTAPAGSANRLELNAGEWLSEVVENFRDEMVRNSFAKTFHDVPVVARAEGSVGGAITPIMPWYILDAFAGGTEVKADLFDDTPVTPVDTGMDAHSFVIGRTPRSLTMQQSDNIAVELFLGMIPTSFTLRFNAGEGAVEWEAEFIGKGRTFPTTAKTVVNFPAITTLPAKSLVGSMAYVSIGPVYTDNVVTTPGDETAKIMEMEVVFSRELTISYGANNTMRPNIIRTTAPTISFTATVELQLESDIQKYAFDAGDNVDAQASAVTFNESTATFFDSNIEAWHIRIGTDRDVTTSLTPLPTHTIGASESSTLGGQMGTAANSDRCVIDLYFDSVSYAEAPIVVDRSENTATFEFNATVHYNVTNSRLGVFRVFNEKVTAYTDNDNTP